MHCIDFHKLVDEGVCGALTGRHEEARGKAREPAIMRIDCASESRGGSLGSNPPPKLDLLYSPLPWQAIIRKKAGTDMGDNRVGGRRRSSRGHTGRRTGTKMEARKKRAGGELMEKMNVMKRRQKEERKAE